MSQVRKIKFVGRGPDSKSLLNRAWIVKSYCPDFQIKGASLCDDVQIIKKAVKSLKSREEIHCGASAAALRFMALRASREKGEFILTGEKNLFSRPHKDLFFILNQLGVKAFFHDSKKLVIESQGWRPAGDALVVFSNKSSQFASSVFLNSFNLEKDLFVSIEGPMVSVSYLKMTLSFLAELGFEVKGHTREFHIPKGQKIKKNKYTVEQDMSSLFALACFASLRGKAVFTPWPQKSLQPDFIFPSLLEKIGVKVEEKNNTLQISSSGRLKGAVFNLRDYPDVFPCLSVLCALSEGVSLLYGAPHLKGKESNRIELSAQLIQKMGRAIEIRQDGLCVKGAKLMEEGKKIIFDPFDDHRMAMAAGLLIYAGLDVEIKNPLCVNKSFPDFWNIIGVGSAE